MPSRRRIVILNGVGSVGKTSTGRALQAVTSTPFLLVSMDAFLEMLPARMVGDPDGIVFETTNDDGTPSVAIHSGPVMHRVMRGMRKAIAAMVAEGNDLIVDDVLMGQEAALEYRRVLAPFTVRLVGLFAPLDVLEARERARGDRAIGLARWQYARVHRDVAYDLEIDTSCCTPRDSAERIRATSDL